MSQSRQGIGKHRLAADFSPTVPQLRSLLRLVLDPEGQAERAKTPLLDSASRLFPETPSVELRVELSLFPCLASLELLTIAAGRTQRTDRHC